MRSSFGWSRDELAKALCLEAGTLGAWEAAGPRPAIASSTRLGRLLWAAGSSHGSRVALYARAMLPKSFLLGVKYATTRRFFVYGREWLLLAMSDLAKEDFPALAAFEGLPIADLLTGRVRRLYHETVDEVEASVLAGDPPVVRIVTDGRGFSVPILASYREYVITFPIPGKFFADVTCRDIGKHEYLVREQLGFEIIRDADPDVVN
jgi:hypothetical protein